MAQPPDVKTQADPSISILARTFARGVGRGAGIHNKILNCNAKKQLRGFLDRVSFCEAAEIDHSPAARKERNKQRRSELDHVVRLIRVSRQSMSWPAMLIP
jgi:hypothetical protein